MYQCGYEGQLAYYKDANVYLSDTYPAAKIPPVIKVQLNSHNITGAEKAVLDVYKYDDYYSLMHDGISKFGHELNWVYVRGIDDDCAVFSLPYCLNKIRGGITGVNAAHDVASVVASDFSAYHMTWTGRTKLYPSCSSCCQHWRWCVSEC